MNFDENPVFILPKAYKGTASGEVSLLRAFLHSLLHIFN